MQKFMLHVNHFSVDIKYEGCVHQSVEYMYVLFYLTLVNNVHHLSASSGFVHSQVQSFYT